jgi:Rrf2 family transcriptional regulator, iron-sulfur cluster assembly transcription factor
MSLLSRKSLLAVAAVIDVALHARDQLVSAKDLAARHALPARHLEPVLQALVREGVLKGVRGPHGGYELARERRRISVNDILNAAGSSDVVGEIVQPGSNLLEQVVVPAVAQAEKVFVGALSRITVEDLARRAEPFTKTTDES